MNIYLVDVPYSENFKQLECCNFDDDANNSFHIRNFFHLSLSLFVRFPWAFPYFFLCYLSLSFLIYFFRNVFLSRS